MPSFSHKMDFILTAGANANDIDLQQFRTLKDPRIVAVQGHIDAGTGTGLLNVSLVDVNYTYAVALIDTEPLWQPNFGKQWYGSIPIGDFGWLRIDLMNAVAADVLRIVLVIEHD